VSETTSVVVKVESDTFVTSWLETSVVVSVVAPFLFSPQAVIRVIVVKRTIDNRINFCMLSIKFKVYVKKKPEITVFVSVFRVIIGSTLIHRILSCNTHYRLVRPITPWRYNYSLTTPVSPRLRPGSVFDDLEIFHKNTVKLAVITFHWQPVNRWVTSVISWRTLLLFSYKFYLFYKSFCVVD